jgi:hypothetical protein
MAHATRCLLEVASCGMERQFSRHLLDPCDEIQTVDVSVTEEHLCFFEALLGSFYFFLYLLFWKYVHKFSVNIDLDGHNHGHH